MKVRQTILVIVLLLVSMTVYAGDRYKSHGCPRKRRRHKPSVSVVFHIGGHRRTHHYHHYQHVHVCRYIPVTQYIPGHYKEYKRYKWIYTARGKYRKRYIKRVWVPEEYKTVWVPDPGCYCRRSCR